jgi:hypothetical protein
LLSALGHSFFYSIYSVRPIHSTHLGKQVVKRIAYEN